MALLAALTRSIDKRGFTAFLPLWIFIGIVIASILAVQPRVPSDILTKAAYWGLLLLGAALAFDLMSDEKWQARVISAITFSAALVAALGLLQYIGFRVCDLIFPVFPGYTQRVYSVFGNQDLYGGYLVLGLPLLIHRVSDSRMRPRDWLPLLGFAVVIPGILISGSRSAWLAAGLGTAFSVCMSRRSGLPQCPRPETRNPTPAIAGLAALLVAITLWLAPSATLDRVFATFTTEDRGAHARLWMWEGTLYMLRDAPILGVGLNNYGYWSPRYLGESAQGPRCNAQVQTEFYADQPHSEPLRLLAETGLIGAGCWFWMAARIIRVSGLGSRVPGFAKSLPVTRNPKPDTRYPILGALLGFFVFALFNGPFDSVAHTFVGLLLAAMLLARAREAPMPPSPSLSLVAPILAAVLGGFLLLTVHVPSYLLRAAENAHLSAQADVSPYARAVSYPWPNFTAHKERGLALAEVGRNEEARQELLKALEGLDTGDIYLALAMLAAQSGDRQATLRWAAECLFRWPGNPDAMRLVEMRPAPGSR